MDHDVHILASLQTVPGFLGAALVGPSGEIEASIVSSPDVDLESFAREANDALYEAEQTMVEMKAGECRLIYLEGSEARILAQCAGRSEKQGRDDLAHGHLHGILVLKPEGQLGMGKLRLGEAMASLLQWSRPTPSAGPLVEVRGPGS